MIEADTTLISNQNISYVYLIQPVECFYSRKIKLMFKISNKKYPKNFII